MRTDRTYFVIDFSLSPLSRSLQVQTREEEEEEEQQQQVFIIHHSFQVS